MIDLTLDLTRHDLKIENYDLSLITGVDRVKQTLKTRLWFFKGEWFLDTSAGLDYYGYINVKNPNLDIVASVIKATILDTKGVEELLEYSQEYDSQARSLEVNFSVKILDEIIQLKEVF